MSSPAQQFAQQARIVSGDLRHRSLIRNALRNYEIVHEQRKGNFQDWQAARQVAAKTKWEAINHLDKYLQEFTEKLESRGTKIHWASTAEQAREIILNISSREKSPLHHQIQSNDRRGDSSQRSARASGV
jgi:L-lactate dehydrogenase complex protein LldF